MRAGRLRLLACPNRYWLALLPVVGSAAIADPASAAPTSLYGKSVVLTWSEVSQQRFVGEGSFHTVSRNVNLSVYVSSAGRVFIRQTNSTRLGSGSGEQIAGQRNTGPMQPCVPVFSGQSMTIFAPMQTGGVRRISVEFGAGFGDCSASSAYGKEAGHATSRAYSPITKSYVEIASVSVGNVSCSVQNGNVFGGN